MSPESKQKRRIVTKRYREKNKETRSQYYKEWYAKNGRKRDPLKQRAHGQVAKAIKSGRLKRATECSNCSVVQGWARIEAHHDDYSQPLNVIWLCTACHRSKHTGY